MNQALRTHSALGFSVVLLAALSGCSRSANATASESAPAPAPMSIATTTTTPEAAAGIPSVKNRALVVTIEMALIVDDVDRAVGRARAAVDRAGGYVDVTEEHADLEARLGNARTQEKRIAEIMKNRGAHHRRSRGRDERVARHRALAL